MLLYFQTSPSTFFFSFLFFSFFAGNINVDSILKISDCKINVLKVEHVQNTFKNLNSSELALKMLKTMQIYQNAFFFVFLVVFLLLLIFMKIYKKIWVKIR